MTTIGFGLGLVSAAYRGSTLIYEWAPDRLFLGDKAGHWSGGYPARAFTDTAGTTLATVGSSVARVNRRNGTLDATQATASKRPILARWPKGGRRNVISMPTSGKAFSVTYTTANDVTTITPTTDNNADHRYKYYHTEATVAVHVFSIELKANGYTGIVLSHSGGGFGPVYVNLLDGSYTGTATVTALDDGWWRIVITRASGAIKDGTNLFINPTYAGSVQTYAGDGVSGVLARKAQAEVGSTPTAWQRVVSAYDITESGVDDVYHLVSDGVDDSLPVTLPAGTYGRAWVDNLGAVTIDSLTLSAATDCDLLLGTSVADAIYRQGAFTSAEQAALQSYWEGKYQA